MDSKIFINKALDSKITLGLSAFVKETGYPFDPLKVNPIVECDDTFNMKVPSEKCWKVCKQHLVNFMRLVNVYHEYEQEHERKYNGHLVKDIVVHKSTCEICKKIKDVDEKNCDRCNNIYSVCEKCRCVNWKCAHCRKLIEETGLSSKELDECYECSDIPCGTCTICAVRLCLYHKGTVTCGNCKEKIGTVCGKDGCTDEVVRDHKCVKNKPSKKCDDNDCHINEEIEEESSEERDECGICEICSIKLRVGHRETATCDDCCEMIGTVCGKSGCTDEIIKNHNCHVEKDIEEELSGGKCEKCGKITRDSCKICSVDLCSKHTQIATCDGCGENIGKVCGKNKCTNEIFKLHECDLCECGKDMYMRCTSCCIALCKKCINLTKCASCKTSPELSYCEDEKCKDYIFNDVLSKCTSCLNYYCEDCIVDQLCHNCINEINPQCCICKDVTTTQCKACCKCSSREWLCMAVNCRRKFSKKFKCGKGNQDYYCEKCAKNKPHEKEDYEEICSEDCEKICLEEEELIKPSSVNKCFCGKVSTKTCESCKIKKCADCIKSYIHCDTKDCRSLINNVALCKSEKCKKECAKIHHNFCKDCEGIFCVRCMDPGDKCRKCAIKKEGKCYVCKEPTTGTAVCYKCQTKYCICKRHKGNEIAWKCGPCGGDVLCVCGKKSEYKCFVCGTLKCEECTTHVECDWCMEYIIDEVICTEENCKETLIRENTSVCKKCGDGCCDRCISDPFRGLCEKCAQCDICGDDDTVFVKCKKCKKEYNACKKCSKKIKKHNCNICRKKSVIECYSCTNEATKKCVVCYNDMCDNDSKIVPNCECNKDAAYVCKKRDCMTIATSSKKRCDICGKICCKKCKSYHRCPNCNTYLIRDPVCNKSECKKKVISEFTKKCEKCGKICCRLCIDKCSHSEYEESSDEN
jgi:hypothetical protein